MKLTLTLLIFCIVSFGASTYSQTTRMDFTYNGSNIVELFKQLEEKSGFYFFYQKEDLSTLNDISIDTKNASVTEILDKILKGTTLQYKIVDRYIIIRNTGELSGPGAERMQQPRSVSGKVTDSSGIPMPGVTVTIKGTTRGTVTAADGTYTLSQVQPSAVLVFSFIGMKTEEVMLTGKNTIDLSMYPTIEDIAEVIVVGYDTQKRVNLTGAVQSVSQQDLVRRSVPNVSSALQGLAPGVSVVQGSGEPGAGASIKIRGTGSLNSTTSPLMLIDGVEGSIDFIDMNSIESVTILKDAASASIYGSRSSNGVILVTTKRAKSGELKIAYQGYAGVNTPTDLPEPVSAIEYMEAINTASLNADANPQYTEEYINEYRTLGADNLNRYDTDWRGLVLSDLALVHNHSVSISGGSQKVSFFANAGYYYQDGHIANNRYDRMTLRINTDTRMTDWLKVGLDVNIRQSEDKEPALESPISIIGKAITFVPILSGINNDGTWGYGQNGDNPIATAEASGVSTATTPELGVKGFMEINPFKGLNITTSYSSRRVETKSDYFIKPYDTYEGGVFKTSYPASGAKKYERWSQSMFNQFNLQASYEQTIKGHSIKLLGGIQTEEKTGRAFQATRQGYNYDGFEDLNDGDVSTALNSGTHWAWTMLSWYSRLNYNFRERYLLELNGRWDASSRFMKGHRWGFFPSASLGWRISEEPFFSSVKRVVSNLKIRGSYGTLGNQDIVLNGTAQYYPYAASISSGYGYWFNEQLGTGVAQTQAANEQISWEKSTQMNAGLDADLWESRLSFSFDYYVRKIHDMLQQFPIPLYVGLSSSWENAGSMRNNGWDLTLTYRNSAGKLNYHVTANLSDVRNKVTNLYGKEYVGTQITREGEALGSWYGYVSKGYFQSQDEIDASPVYGPKASVKPGYIKYEDLSGENGEPDGVIDAYDRKIIGNPAPRYEFSLNMGADWKGFDFSLFLQGVGKKEIFYAGNGARPFYVGRTIFRNQLDYWTENNRDAKFPILLIDGSGSNPNNLISDFWVKSGAYMRIKNVVVGYTLPKTLLQRMNMESIRVYASAQNLFTLSDAYEGYDPENSVSNGAFYPLMQTFTIGMDIRF
jgi:TonB-linked SusC/RagA family outer membrane protein